MAAEYTFREFKRAVNGCSENKIKQDILLDYLKADAALFNRYFEKLRLEISIAEQKQKLEALQAAETEAEENENI